MGLDRDDLIVRRRVAQKLIRGAGYIRSRSTDGPRFAPDLRSEPEPFSDSRESLVHSDLF
jgi:hypothetical protein